LQWSLKRTEEEKRGECGGPPTLFDDECHNGYLKNSDDWAFSFISSKWISFSGVLTKFQTIHFCWPNIICFKHSQTTNFKVFVTFYWCNYYILLCPTRCPENY
jgi:hypothetical protein